MDSGRLAECHGHMHEGEPHLAALYVCGRAVPHLSEQQLTSLRHNSVHRVAAYHEH